MPTEKLPVEIADGVYHPSAPVCFRLRSDRMCKEEASSERAQAQSKRSRGRNPTVRPAGTAGGLQAANPKPRHPRDDLETTLTKQRGDFVQKEIE
eukprot:3723392-Pleurochrysis_carterae.AAC.6